MAATLPFCAERNDDGLTDINWLQNLSVGANIPFGNILLPMDDNSLEKESIVLSSVRNDRPPLSYGCLIALALCSNPLRRLHLQEIYQWIESKFPYYRGGERSKAWKVCTTQLNLYIGVCQARLTCVYTSQAIMYL